MKTNFALPSNEGPGYNPRGDFWILYRWWRVLVVGYIFGKRKSACGNQLKFGLFPCSSLQNNWQNHRQSENSRGGNCLLLPHAGYAYARRLSTVSSENRASHTWQTNSFSILRINWYSWSWKFWTRNWMKMLFSIWILSELAIAGIRLHTSVNSTVKDRGVEETRDGFTIIRVRPTRSGVGFPTIQGALHYGSRKVC